MPITFGRLFEGRGGEGGRGGHGVWSDGWIRMGYHFVLVGLLCWNEPEMPMSSGALDLLRAVYLRCNDSCVSSISGWRRRDVPAN